MLPVSSTENVDADFGDHAPGVRQFGGVSFWSSSWSSASRSGFSFAMPRRMEAKMPMRDRKAGSCRGFFEKRARSYRDRKSAPRVDGLISPSESR